MKNQYFGDISDYYKYGILRALLRGNDLRLGVVWMLTYKDNRPDGRKMDYLKRPDPWRAFDPNLYDGLREQAVTRRRKSVSAIVGSGLLPRTCFFSRWLEDNLVQRHQYFRAMLQDANGRHLLFFDPDNGLEVQTVHKGQKNSCKYLYGDEVVATWALGHSLLIYQHFPREDRGIYINRKVDWLQLLTGASQITSFATPHVVFLLVPQPAHVSSLRAGADRVAEHWGAKVEVVDYWWKK